MQQYKQTAASIKATAEGCVHCDRQSSADQSQAYNDAAERALKTSGHNEARGRGRDQSTAITHMHVRDTAQRKRNVAVGKGRSGRQTALVPASRAWEQEKQEKATGRDRGLNQLSVGRPGLQSCCP